MPDLTGDIVEADIAQSVIVSIGLLSWQSWVLVAIQHKQGRRQLEIRQHTDPFNRTKYPFPRYDGYVARSVLRLSGPRIVSTRDST